MNENFYFELLRFFGGNGTADNPYKINSEDDLRQLANDVNDGNNYRGKFFILTADITLDGEWTPIGDFVDRKNNEPFSGTFDGDGHGRNCRQNFFRQRREDYNHER